MIVAGREISGARLVDVAPTILYLLGEPIPEDMDGVVLRDALADDFVTSRPIVAGAADSQTADAQATTYVSQEERIISQRLQDLGYLE